MDRIIAEAIRVSIEEIGRGKDAALVDGPDEPTIVREVPDDVVAWFFDKDAALVDGPDEPAIVREVPDDVVAWFFDAPEPQDSDLPF